MNIKVHIESGLHQGAEHLIHGNCLKIGSSEHADVFISDSGVPDEVLILEKQAEHWKVTYLDDDSCLKADNQKLLEVDDLVPGRLYFEHPSLRMSLVLETNNNELQGSDEFLNLLHQEKGQKKSDLNDGGRKKNIYVMASIAIGLAITVFFMASSFVSARNLSKAELAEYQRMDMKNQLGVDQLPDNGPPVISGVMSVQEPSTRVIQSINEVLQDTQRKLNKAELFESTIQGNQLTIEARLSRRQIQILEKSIAQLSSDFGDRLQIKATVSLNTEQQIVDEIEVRQVVMGNMPFVILNDGTTLFAGSSYHGLTLSSINFDKLEFKGEQMYVSLI
ncbi:FHA domain-containing protein [Limnobacter humi]|uniref:FHA domain-containing protein n=1 Tax=Limnobacter humi TaxID=1778671 RepID=A0ABT1WGK0_9BURK|nr:FHA domain-containing protein [Limnobacter humi]MCQ8895554.1 FHA domain-containing protein [Limnobacter humi]